MRCISLRLLPVVILSCAAAACAPLYVQPPVKDNAQLRTSTESNVPLVSIQYWLNGKDCSERLRVTPEESKKFEAGEPIVLPAGREFSATLQATRAVELIGTVIRRESCDAGASFIPQPNMNYKVVFVARSDRCEVVFLRVINSGSGTREQAEPSYRSRKTNRHSCAAD